MTQRRPKRARVRTRGRRRKRLVIAVVGSLALGIVGGAEASDLEDARAGLGARLVGMDPIEELAPLGECPVVERDEVIAALRTAGVDAPLESMLAEQGPSLGDGRAWQASGIVCSGSYVGFEGDPSFPELRIEVMVADFGDTAEFHAFVADAHPGLAVDDPLNVTSLAGGTIGRCEHVDLTERCAEFWEQDGFVLGVLAADRVYVDRPTVSAMLGELAPVIVASLAAEPPVAVASGVTVPPDVLGAARARLLALSTAGGPLACPIIGQAAVDVALSDAGIDLRTDDWYSMAWDGTTAAVAGVECAGAAGQGALRIEVLDLGSSAAAADMMELVRGCERMGDTEFCVESWEQDGVTVTVVVTAVGADVAQPDVRALVDSLAPVIITRLAG